MQITEPNGNRAAVKLDALGLALVTAVTGKAGGAEGDTLDDPTTTLEEIDEGLTAEITLRGSGASELVEEWVLVE